MAAPSEEALAGRFDVALLGTSLPNAILAGALGRVGLEVLLLDQSGPYGDSWASFTLPEALEFFACDHASAVSAQPELGPGVGSSAAEAVGGDEQWSAHALTQALPSLPDAPQLSFTRDGDTRDWRVMVCESTTLAPALAEDKQFLRGWTLDCHPALIASRGPMVDALVAGGTNEYLEFRTCDSANVFMPGAGGGPTPDLFTVPCSKAAIFGDSTLTLGEKRTLMKFMVQVLDAAGAAEVGDATRLNEARLAKGRALLRPQNKASGAATAVQGTFPDFLRAAGLSDRLVAVLMHAVALVNPAEGQGGAISAQEGMSRLVLYVGAAGQFGTTSFILPNYGMGDVTQAFVRLAAVCGGVTLVAQTPAAVVTAPHTAPPQAAETPETPATQGPPPTVGVLVDSGVVFKAGAVVASTRYLAPFTVEGRLLRGEACPLPAPKHTVTLHCRGMGLLKLAEGASAPGRKYVVALPGVGGAAASAAAHVLVLDHTAKVAPQGYVVVHVGSQVQCEVDPTLPAEAAGIMQDTAAAGAAAVRAVLHTTVHTVAGAADASLWEGIWCSLHPRIIPGALPPGVLAADDWAVAGQATGPPTPPHGAAPSDSLFFHAEYDVGLARDLFRALVDPDTPFLPPRSADQPHSAAQPPASTPVATPPPLPGAVGAEDTAPVLDADALAALDDLDF